MSTKTTIKYALVTFIVAMIIIALLFVVGKADGAQSTPTCPSDTTCHWLMESNSDSYVLCSDGTLSLVENGVDSWYLSCAHTDKETAR